MEETKEMVLSIVKYYRSGWKEAFKNLWKTNGVVVYLIFWEFLFPWYSLEEHSVLEVLVYYGLSLPVMAGCLHSFMYPNRLDKTMFLCPLGEKERKCFLTTAYWFRIACMLGTSILIIICMLIAGLIQYSVYLAGFLASEGIFAAVSFLWMDTITIDAEKALKINGYIFFRCAVWVISILSCVFWGVMATAEHSEKSSYGNMEIIIMIAVFAIQVLPFWKMMVNYQRKIMGIAADYEKSYLIQKNKHI